MSTTSPEAESGDQATTSNTMESAPSLLEQYNALVAQLWATGESGANWFYWVAGLSLVNTVMAHTGADRHFVIGLAVPAVVDAIAQGIATEHPDEAWGVRAFAIGFSVVLSLAGCGFAYFSRHRWLWIFGIGMFLYLLDGLLYLLLGDYLSFGFHAYALAMMGQGFNAFRKLKTVESHAPQVQGDVPAATANPVDSELDS